MYADSGGQLVRFFKTDSVNVIRQSVRIFFQNSIQPTSVGIVNLYRQCVGNAELLQINHRLTHFLFIFHLSSNIHGLFFADSLNLRQTFRLLFNDPKRVFSKTLYNPRRQCRSYSLDRSGSQITFHPGRIFRRCDLI